MADIRLIVGLGNPGPRYDTTRHNVGAQFVQALAARFALTLVDDAKFKGAVGRGTVAGVDLRLLIPNTYMNLSGQSVGPLAHFYKIAATEILVAYDEVAFEPGIVRLKSGGGANGHNGIMSVADGLGSKDFHRLRIGVGHPGDKELMTSYLTSVTMPALERELAEAAYRLDDDVIDSLVHGQMQAAMNGLHKPKE
ncbi:MAG: aminoacyl-tRNA hydrolase [Gammaproteobacteria bacterium]|nr:aminoacyl-tRNA hydrolase [Gammaproteobacteria bacterium]